MSKSDENIFCQLHLKHPDPQLQNKFLLLLPSVVDVPSVDKINLFII